MTRRELNILSYLQKYHTHAVAAEKQSGVPALVALAQSALESGFGTAKPQNMMFGIKATPAWKGKRQYLSTWECCKLSANNSMGEPWKILKTVAPHQQGNPCGKCTAFRVMDWFRAYDSPLDSFLDYGNFLRRNSRYASAFQTTDAYAFASRIAKAGYATAPNYERVLLSLMRELEGVLKKNDL